MDGALVVGVSQSGESPDLVAVVEEGRRQGCPTLAITNVAGSPLTAVADHTILLRAGHERSIAATKTYTAPVAGAGDAVDGARRGRRAAPASCARARRWRRPRPRDERDRLTAARVLKDAGHGVVIGRGFNYATAFEICAQGQGAGVRGRRAVSGGRLPARPDRAHRDGVRGHRHQRGRCGEPGSRGPARRDGARGARPVVLSNLRRRSRWGRRRCACPADMPEWLSPIAAVVPGQLLAFHLSRQRGFDPDQPRGLKKVTLTTQRDSGHRTPARDSDRDAASGLRVGCLTPARGCRRAVTRPTACSGTTKPESESRIPTVQHPGAGAGRGARTPVRSTSREARPRMAISTGSGGLRDRACPIRAGAIPGPSHHVVGSSSSRSVTAAASP